MANDERQPDPGGGAALLRKLLAAVDDGQLDANSSAATVLRRRVEGAIIASELAVSGSVEVADVDERTD